MQYLANFIQRLTSSLALKHLKSAFKLTNSKAEKKLIKRKNRKVGKKKVKGLLIF